MTQQVELSRVQSVRISGVTRRSVRRRRLIGANDTIAVTLATTGVHVLHAVHSQHAVLLVVRMLRRTTDFRCWSPGVAGAI